MTATNNNIIMTTPLTEAPAKKRKVAFDTETDTLGADPEHPAPSSIALNIITAAVELHPAPIQRLCTFIFHRYSALKNKEKQQQSTNSRLLEATFFPRSARLAFEMRASASVMETKSFKTLATNMAKKHPNGKWMQKKPSWLSLTWK